VSLESVLDAVQSCVEYGISVDLTPLYAILHETGILGGGADDAPISRDKTRLRREIPAQLDATLVSIVHEYFGAIPGSDVFVFTGKDVRQRRDDDYTDPMEAPHVGDGDTWMSEVGTDHLVDDGVISFTCFGSSVGTFAPGTCSFWVWSAR
jgi:hypothetical protein